MPFGICVNAIPAQQLLFGVEGAMIGRYGVDQARSHRVPQCFLIALRAQWRGHHVLHALNARPFRISLVQHQMRDDTFDG